MPTLSFEPLTKFTPLDSFDCGDGPGCRDLEDFLKNDALEEQNLNVTRVTLAYDEKDILVGFYALSCHGMRIEERDKAHMNLDSIRYQALPAILLARLAVHKDYRDAGIGKALLLRAIGQALEVPKFVGCRFLVAHAYEHKMDWYKRNKFVQSSGILKDHDPPIVIMRLDLFPASSP